MLETFGTVERVLYHFILPRAPNANDSGEHFSSCVTWCDKAHFSKKLN